AERDRLRAGLRSRAAEFAGEFDREITRLYLAFQIDADLRDEEAAAKLADAYATSRSPESGETLVRGVYLVHANASGVINPRVLDPAARTLTPAAWPPELEAWQRRVSALHTTPPAPLPPLFPVDAVDAATPALVIPLPALKRIERGADIAY